MLLGHPMQLLASTCITPTKAASRRRSHTPAPSLTPTKAASRGAVTPQLHHANQGCITPLPSHPSCITPTKTSRTFRLHQLAALAKVVVEWVGCGHGAAMCDGGGGRGHHHWFGEACGRVAGGRASIASGCALDKRTAATAAYGFCGYVRGTGVAGARRQQVQLPGAGACRQQWRLLPTRTCSLQLH